MHTVWFMPMFQDCCVADILGCQANGPELAAKPQAGNVPTDKEQHFLLRVAGCYLMNNCEK